jgi:1-aminocyclopropane-1-carboxylate deaminase/D-cysteine desulfhydrase-like pyridoxal-dependent ACC family enzyme
MNALHRPRHGLLANLPRLELAHLPTPLDPAPRLTAALGGPPIFVKREDLSGLGLGGNKARQVEVLLAVALADGADTIVTTAAAHSNFCRTIAAACARIGLGCVLLLRGNPDMPLTGNLLLDHLFGAEISFIPTRDPYDPAIPARLEKILSRLRADGRKPHVLHLPGATGALGAAATVSLAEELTAQWRERAITPAALVVVASSGLTMAGTLLGLRHLGARTSIIGMCAQMPAAFLRPLIARRCNEAAALLGIPTTIDESQIDLDETALGAGYGIPNAATIEAIELGARMEGLVLDPVYTGKAMAGIIAQIRAGRWRGDAPVVFVHSGGTPTLFAMGADALHIAQTAPETKSP